jgi:hypothetical protein
VPALNADITNNSRAIRQPERSLEDPLESVGDGKEHQDLSKPVEYNDASLASGA